MKFKVGRGNQETIVVSFKIRLAFSIYLNRASNISLSPLGAPAGLVPVYILVAVIKEENISLSSHSEMMKKSRKQRDLEHTSAIVARKSHLPTSTQAHTLLFRRAV